LANIYKITGKREGRLAPSGRGPSISHGGGKGEGPLYLPIGEEKEKGPSISPWGRKREGPLYLPIGEEKEKIEIIDQRRRWQNVFNFL
jgi:hypothetical protein